MRLRKRSGMTVLLCVLSTMLFPANAFAYAAQADGNVDPALVEQANDLLDLLPEYIIDALEDEDVPIYITDKDIDDYFSTDRPVQPGVFITLIMMVPLTFMLKIQKGPYTNPLSMK